MRNRPKKRLQTLAGARVAIVLTTLELGGAERQALHLASYLQDRCGAHVAVVALFGGTGDQPVRKMCIERRLPCLRVNMPAHHGGVPTFRSVRQFARDLSFLQPDVLLPYTALPNILCSIVWQKVCAAACIWNQRDEGRELSSGRWQDLALRNASRFISNSTDGVEFLTKQRGVSSHRIDLIFNGVELPPPGESASAVRQKLGVSTSSFLAVMLANIHQYKDHATLVRAWKMVCERLPELDPILILAGRKDDADQITKLIASSGLERQVKLIGPVGDVSSLLHAADLSVFSSFQEGTPNAVLESMAAGRAVIATDIAGCRDALGDDYPGLTPRQDPGAMAEKIVVLATNAALRDRLGARLAQQASARFGVMRMCEETVKVILPNNGRRMSNFKMT